MTATSEIPRADHLDSTLALATDGYTFISKRCQRLQTNVFQTRLLLQKVICMRGEEAARLFYDEERFKREGAAPKRAKKTLFGQGGVQGLDDQIHRRRKEMFMSLMTPEGIERLVDLTTEQWRAYLEKWEAMDRVVLFDEVRELLCRAVCAWTGVPLPESEVQQRTADLAALIDGSGAVGLRHWQGRWARTRSEQWIGGLIEKVRTQELEVPEGSALHAVAWYRDPEGELLDRNVAAVELLNVLRPTIDVARYVTFAALALHEHPASPQHLQSGEDETIEQFVQEVRRFYPFFPFVAARVRTPFDWNGYHFPEGRRTLLDLYGTNHDAGLWSEPDTFRPERFREWEDNAFDFIPQGGGDHHTGHRCPGEWITIALMKEAVRLLTTSMDYDVPEQDLHIDLSQMPALPSSRFVISSVKGKANLSTINE